LLQFVIQLLVHQLGETLVARGTLLVINRALHLLRRKMPSCRHGPLIPESILRGPTANRCLFMLLVATAEKSLFVAIAKSLRSLCGYSWSFQNITPYKHSHPLDLPLISNNTWFSYVAAEVRNL